MHELMPVNLRVNYVIAFKSQTNIFCCCWKMHLIFTKKYGQIMEGYI